MINSKVLSILRSLSQEELKEFTKFNRSPFFGKCRDSGPLFEIVKKYAPDFNHKNLSKMVLYKKLYPGSQFKDHIMRNLISTLHKQLEEFLSIKSFYKNPAERQRHLLTELVVRKITDVAETDLKKFDKVLTLKSDDVENFYMEKYYLESIKVLHNMQSDKQHLIKESFISNAKFIVLNFLASASVSIVNMKNNEENFNHDYSGNFLGEFLSGVNLKSFVNTLQQSNLTDIEKEIAEIYSSIIITIREPEEEVHYFRLSKLLLKNLDNFNRVEKYNLLITLGTCTSMKSTIISREKFLPELFKIYKLRLEKELYNFSDNQNMSFIFFYSILKLGLTLKHISWAEKFVKENIKKLSPEHQNNMKIFSLSQIHFAKREYTTSLEELSKVQFVSPSFKFELRNLQLQLYYELNEFETALYAIDSYKHFLRSSKTVSEYFRVSSEEFLELYSKLLKLKMGSGSLSRKLKKNIDDSRVSQKDWLKEKFKELEKNTRSV